MSDPERGRHPGLTAEQRDRAVGVLVATACGDALGAGYEYGLPVLPDQVVVMEGGGAWGPGEWTDDTAMAVAIAEVAADGVDLREPEALTRIGRRWKQWAAAPKGIGMQTATVLSRVGPTPTGSSLMTAAARLHEQTGRTAGNGSLMRTAPIALAYLHDPEGLTQAAQMVSSLTHHDPEAGEACAMWCLAIRHAVLYGTFDGLRLAVADLPDDRAAIWSARLTEAEACPPSAFDRNGWVVQAVQGAWSAISRTPVPVENPGRHLQLALEAIVRGGGDTDTVAAIAGGLLGARWGAMAIPDAWTQLVHGWPDMRAGDLETLALDIVSTTQNPA
jgi:ADP-ribosyl-[dinitrogen reductase] hydrolase